MGARFSRNKDKDEGRPDALPPAVSPEHLPPQEHRLEASAADPSAWCTPLCDVPDYAWDLCLRKLAPEAVDWSKCEPAQCSADRLPLRVPLQWSRHLIQWRTLAMLRAASRRMRAIVMEELPGTGWPRLSNTFFRTLSVCGEMTPRISGSHAMRGNEEPRAAVKGAVAWVLVSSNGYCGRASFMNVCAGGQRPEPWGQHQLGINWQLAKPHMPKCDDPLPIKIFLARSQAWQLRGAEQMEKVMYHMATNSQSPVYARVLQFAVTDRHSFDQIVEISKSIKEIEEQNPPGVPCCVAVLVGTMADCEARREVSADEGLAMGECIGMPYFECSASTGPGGVDEVWKVITSCLENAMIRQCAQARTYLAY
jgi:hypothetical protein